MSFPDIWLCFHKMLPFHCWIMYMPSIYLLYVKKDNVIYTFLLLNLYVCAIQPILFIFKVRTLSYSDDQFYLCSCKRAESYLLTQGTGNIYSVCIFDSLHYYLLTYIYWLGTCGEKTKHMLVTSQTFSTYIIHTGRQLATSKAVSM